VTPVILYCSKDEIQLFEKPKICIYENQNQFRRSPASNTFLRSNVCSGIVSLHLHLLIPFLQLQLEYQFDRQDCRKDRKGSETVVPDAGFHCRRDPLTESQTPLIFLWQACADCIDSNIFAAPKRS
jgi:hypothetical protein